MQIAPMRKYPHGGESVDIRELRLRVMSANISRRVNVHDRPKDIMVADIFTVHDGFNRSMLENRHVSRYDVELRRRQEPQAAE